MSAGGFTKAFADYLVTNLSLVPGRNFHLLYFPDHAEDHGTALLLQGGSNFNPYNLKQRDWTFNILTRGMLPHMALTEAERIFRFCVGIRNAEPAGFWIYSAEGIGPQALGQDAKGRHEYRSQVLLRTRERP